MLKINYLQVLLASFSISSLFFSGCSSDDVNEDEARAGFLYSELNKLPSPEFSIPLYYDLSGAFAPGTYAGQTTRLNQLKEIVSLMRTDPIAEIEDDAIVARLKNEDDEAFDNVSLNGQNKDIASKIDENATGANGLFTFEVRDAFLAMADSIEDASKMFEVTAADGKAGQLGTTRRFVSSKGLEYAQVIEKGLFGACFYSQMADDYLTAGKAGALNSKGNNQEQSGDDYASEGTSRQHAFDEAFGYFGANAVTYPNSANSSDGDGVFLANYIFDYSDETESAFGVNLAQNLMSAFVMGRAALKAGEGATAADEKDYENYYDAARKDVLVYTEAGIAAAALHYLNSALTDTNDEDRLHHLAEAVSFIYALAFNQEGRVSAAEVHEILKIFGWSQTDAFLTGIYDINFWTVSASQVQEAKTRLEGSFPGYSEVMF